MNRGQANHGLLARMHLDHIDHLSAMIDGLDERIEQVAVPFAQQITLLQTEYRDLGADYPVWCQW